jgi:membrane associated rhomboid family serine protease
MSSYSQIQWGAPLTPVVKRLLILNVLVWFLLQLILENLFKVQGITSLLALKPGDFLFDLKIWQVFTYIFLHSTSDVFHILFNMLMLWFFGAELEQRWGGRAFLLYFLACGVGAALIYVLGIALYSLSTGSQMGLYVPVVGASGAIFGLLLAQGILFGERMIHFLMIFPMKVKYFVTLMGALQVANLMTSGFAGGEVAYLAHLGGLFVGYVYLLVWSGVSKRKNQNKNKRRSGNLRLVVDNKSEESSKKGPRYWN